MKNVLSAAFAGFVAGAVGAAAVVGVKTVVDKVKGEIKADTNEQCFISPDGNNRVVLTCGASESAKGLARIKVVASSDDRGKDCKLSAFAMKKEEMFISEWKDNDRFVLLIGGGKIRRCCDVRFKNNRIMILYYLRSVPRAAVKTAEEV